MQWKNQLKPKLLLFLYKLYKSATADTKDVPYELYNRSISFSPGRNDTAETQNVPQCCLL